MNEVQLVYPPGDERYVQAYQRYAPPFGLVLIASYLKKQGLSDIEILDSQIMPISEIKERLSNGLVAVHVHSLIAYKNSLAIAHEAKRKGADVIFGGPHATNLAREIVQNRSSFVDGVVRYDGEKAIWEYAQGTAISDIPNMVHLSDGKPFFNPIVLNDLNLLSIPDYAAFDLSRYWQFPECHKKILVVASQRGCLWRSGFRNHSTSDKNLLIDQASSLQHSGCAFCGRADIGYRAMSPDCYCSMLKSIKERVGVDRFYDVSDSFAQNILWLEKVSDIRTSSFSEDLELFVFARSDEIDRKTARQLAEIGVSEVILGFESGDREVLKNVNKGSTPEMNVNASILLRDEGISTIANYVLGLPGENARSLQNTIDNASEFVAQSHPNSIEVNLIEPHPGSPIWDSLRRRNPEKYSLNDIHDLREAQLDYFTTSLGIDRSKAEEFIAELAGAANEILKKTPNPGGHGWLKGEIRTRSPSGYWTSTS